MVQRSVLLAVGGDDEDRVEEFASVIESLAAAGDLDVNLLHVYSEDDIEKIESMYDIDSRESRHLGAAAEHNTAVRELESELSDRGYDTVVWGGVGEAGDEIIRIATETDADFVIVGGKSRSPVGKAVFGSTSQEVLLNAPCPVVYTSPTHAD